MKTVKLYANDVYLKEYSSKILDIQTEKENLILILNQTIFFPTGGGQPCDLGTIEGIEVKDVYEKEGIIYHVVDPVPEDKFTLGQTVHLCLDWNRRFYHMQRHCGEHILSGIFFSQLGAINRGFHMGEDYMTIDMDIPGITWEQAMDAELAANEVIWSNAPTTIRHYATKEETRDLPLRKPVNIDRDITIVSVGDINNPSDCVACCGTHPHTAGQVGLIKIIKTENYKGMSRIYFKAGKEAYFDFRTKNEIVNQICKKYSAQPFELLDKIKLQEDKNAQVRKNLFEIKKVLLVKAEEELTQLINSQDSTMNAQGQALNSQKHRINPQEHRTHSLEQKPKVHAVHDQKQATKKQKSDSTPIIRKTYTYFSLEDLQTLGRKVSSQHNALFLLVSQQDNTVMLFSQGSPDCGKLVRENAEIYQGKGGGNNTAARAIFTKMEYVETFMDLIEKHLR